MGITIHYHTSFKGSMEQLTKKLEALQEVAKTIGFYKDMPIYKMGFKSDFNTRDEYTPMEKDDGGKLVIDGNYRWAKIQATPRTEIFSYQDNDNEREQKTRRNEAIRQRAAESFGLVLSLWWGEGCEATNLSFVAYHGDRKGIHTWKGHSFTKTQYASNFAIAHISVCKLLKEAAKLGLVTEVYDEGDYYETEDITVLLDANENSLKLIQAFCGQLQDAFGKKNVSGAGLQAKELLKDYSLGEE